MQFSQDIFRSLGMTLVHSVWQGAVLTAVILTLLAIVKKSNARLRYIVLFSGLMLMMVCFVITFVVVYKNNHVISKWYAFLQQAQPYKLTAKDWPVTPVSLTGRLLGYLDPYYPALAIGWLVGFLVMTVRLTGGTILYRLSLMRSLSEPDLAMQELFDDLHSRMNLPFEVNLRVTHRMISPLVTGVFKPMVILPLAAISGLSTSQIEAVLAHELAHIRRFDHIMIILQAIARQVLFFHPLTWYLVSQIDRERENCCDDYVIHSNNSPINYIKALAMIQEMNLQHAPANGFSGSRSKQLLNRIKRLVNPEIKHSAGFRMAVVAFFITVVGISSMAFIIDNQHQVKSNHETVLKNTPVQDTIRSKKSNTINTYTADKKGTRKRMKIVFTDDSITHMTVNGKSLTPGEMKQYAEEMKNMKAELEASQKQLAEANEQLKEAQRELAMAHMNLGNPPLPPNPPLLNMENKPFDELARLHFNPEEFKFDKEEMKRIIDESQKNWQKNPEEMEFFMKDAMRLQKEAMNAQKEYWEQHQDEWKEQMKKGQEEFKEEMKKFQEQMQKEGNMGKHMNLNFSVPVPPIPDVDSDINVEVPEIPEIPDINIDVDADVPEIEAETPESPEAPEAVEQENSTTVEPAEKSATEEHQDLNTKLQELENEK
ncbi:MAG TPA: M56 family metallopeptidase [Bacteroidales bacterium]|nr:M56 family metallopeptidase [Bacteroidales bacterium]